MFKPEFKLNFSTLHWAQKHYRNQIQQGTIQVPPHQDAVTLAIGVDKGGRVKGAGFGVCPSMFWNVDKRKRQPVKSTADQLRKQVESKDALITQLVMSLKSLASNLAAQGIPVPLIASELIRNHGPKVS